MVHWFIVPVKYELSIAIIYAQGRKSQYQRNYYYGRLLIKNSPERSKKNKTKQNHIWNLLMKNTEGKTSSGKKDQNCQNNCKMQREVERQQLGYVTELFWLFQNPWKSMK